MSTDPRAAFTAGLRKFADALDAHPEVPLPYTATSGVQWFTQNDLAAVAAIVRALPCTWGKKTWEAETQSYLELSGTLDGLRVEINAYRDAVCTRRVTGTEEREVEETVTPAVVRKVTKQVEVVEWDCGSLLRPVPLAELRDRPHYTEDDSPVEAEIHDAGCGPGACTCGAGLAEGCAATIEDGRNNGVTMGCTLTAGHDGDHLANGARHADEPPLTWPQQAGPAPEAAADPFPGARS